MRKLNVLFLISCISFWSQTLQAQEQSNSSDLILPGLVRYCGTALDADGKFIPSIAALKPDPGRRFRVDVLTMAPGAPIYSTWGHTALHIFDSKTGVDVTFDYGIFGFDSAFLIKFLQGHPAFIVAPICTADSFRNYGSGNRRIYAQQIHLNDAQAQALFNRLQINSMPRNRTFLYHHYRDNCTTRIRDQIQRVAGFDLETSFSGKAQADTFRQSSMRMFAHRPILWIGTNLILGSNVDGPVDQWQNQYLPLQFMHALDEYRKQGHIDQIGPIEIVLEGKADFRDGTVLAWTLFLIFYSLLLGLFYVYPLIKPEGPGARWLARLGWLSWTLGAGVLGSVLSLVWFFTNHDSAFNNINLLGYNGFLIILAIFTLIWRRQAKWDLIIQAHQFWVALPLLGLMVTILGISSQFAWPFLLNAALIQSLLWLRFKRVRGS